MCRIDDKDERRLMAIDEITVAPTRADLAGSGDKARSPDRHAQ